VGNAPKQKENGERTAQRRKRIGKYGCSFRRRKYHEKTRKQHEKRCSWGVTYLQLVRGSDEFAAVPETSSGFNGRQVYNRRDGPDAPARPIVQFLIAHVRIGNRS